MSVLSLASLAPNLKAAQIAYFTRPGIYKQTWLLDLDVDIVLSAIPFFILTIKSKREKKKKEKVNVGPSVARKERGIGILLTTSDGD